MYEFKETKELNYSAAQMYALVNDVAHYPEFLPACDKADITVSTSDEMQATLYFSKGFFKQQFKTKNILKENQKIEMNLVEGPFESFYGLWEFSDLSETKSMIFLIFFLASVSFLKASSCSGSFASHFPS